MKQRLLIAFLCLCGYSFVVAQEQTPAPSVNDIAIQHITIQLQNYPEEKIYIQTDKPYYSAGDTIWFKAYLLHAALHKNMHYSRYIYVELINQQNHVVLREKVRPENEMYYCQMGLPSELPAGYYTLRAYTNYMRNLHEDYFFRKDFYIGNMIHQAEDYTRDQYALLSGPAGNSYSYTENDGEADYDVQFFPEGGRLMAGTMQVVGFKSIASNGWGEDIHGRILDESGTEITTFASTHLGMGCFALMAEQGKTYTAVCENTSGEELRVVLPQASEDGYALHVTQRNNKIQISALKPHSVALQEELYVLILLRGIPLFKSVLSADVPFLNVSKSDIPAGVVHILLLNAAGETLSERLCYNLVPQQSQVAIQFEKDNYGKRERAIAKLSFSDDKGLPLSDGDFSISVTDDKYISSDSLQGGIDAYLLLTSDLRGHIEQAGAYFLPGNTAALAQLDILMLTQGWRRYDIPQIILGNYDILNQYEVEAGSTICGKLQTYPIRRPVPNINISAFNGKHSFADAATTDNRGRFCFQGFEFPDSSSFFIQSDKKPGVIWELSIEQENYPQVGISRLIPNTDPVDEQMNAFLHLSRDRFFYENGTLVINLDAVEVKASRVSKIREERGALYMDASNSISSEEIEDFGGASILDLLLRIPGATLNSTGDGILLRNASPAIYVDNMPYTMQDLTNIPISDIELIDVLKDPSQTALYQGGGNGVICVYLKRGQQNKDVVLGSHQKVVPYLGYTSAKTYYQPKYGVQNIKNSSTPDLRSTIYWKPDLIPDENGEAQIHFYTADQKSTYTILIEGVTSKGEPLRCLYRWERK